MADYGCIDADNHYYEPLDAFTRHLAKKFTERGVQVVQQGRRVKLLVGGEVNRFIPNPTFDPIVVAGCLDPLFRGQIPAGVDPRTLMQVEPLRPEYRDREVRADLLPAQGLDSVLLFPTLGVGVEQGLKDDIDATMASLSPGRPRTRGRPDQARRGAPATARGTSHGRRPRTSSAYGPRTAGA
jgi:hypothetical protein